MLGTILLILVVWFLLVCVYVIFNRKKIQDWVTERVLAYGMNKMFNVLEKQYKFK